jgi:hypothetical protein
MDKQNLIIDLLGEGKITAEQAKLLMKTEKEIVTVKEYIYPATANNWGWNQPYYGGTPYTVTCGTVSNGTITYNN